MYVFIIIFRFYIYDLYFSILIDNVLVDPHSCQEICYSKLLVFVFHLFINFSKQWQTNSNFSSVSICNAHEITDFCSIVQKKVRFYIYDFFIFRMYVFIIIFRFYICDLYFSILIDNVLVDPHSCQEICYSKLLVFVFHLFINFSKQWHLHTNWRKRQKPK